MAGFAADFRQATKSGFDRVIGFQPMPGLDVLFIADLLRDRPDAPLAKRLLPRFRAFARLERSCFGPDARTRILGLTQRQMNAFVERYPSSAPRISVLPPTIDPGRRTPQWRMGPLRAAARARYGLREDQPAWLWLGLQPHVKGLDRAVAALARVPGATLLVGGLHQADLRAAPIRARASRLGVSERLRWLGYVSGEDLAGTLAAADVLAHPARKDVTGAVILEAIVNGLPVVATDCCGFAPHVALSGAGRLVSAAFDTDAFAAALAEVGRPDDAALSALGAAYGGDAALYSGLDVACDLMEAASWPQDRNVFAASEQPFGIVPLSGSAPCRP